MSRNGIIQPTIKKLKPKDFWIFSLSDHKYSVIGSAVQTIQRDHPGQEYSLKKNKIQGTLMVTRIQ